MTNKTWCLFAVLILAACVPSSRADQPNILFIFIFVRFNCIINPIVIVGMAV